MSARKRKCVICNKLFKPEYDTLSVRQIVCSNRCCVKHYKKQKPKTRKVARAVAALVGKRSMGEVEFDADYIESNKNIEAAYEPDSFKYTVEETRTYTPDFRIRTPSGKSYYLEYKGVLDLETRKKMVRVRDQYPGIDLRFVFQKAGNPIRKGSKTTYGDWATKNNFLWANNRIPKEWLK